jgi:ABC-type sugar transport system permease subunit
MARANRCRKDLSSSTIRSERSLGIAAAGALVIGALVMAISLLKMIANPRINNQANAS